MSRICTATEARSNIFNLINYTAESGDIVIITGKRNNAVLVSEQDWGSIQATLELTLIPGMVKSIQEGMEEDPANCYKEIDL